MKKRKEIYFIISWVLLTIMVLLVFILPNMKKLTAVAEKVKVKENKLEAMQKSGQNKKETEANYKLIKENISQIEGIIPKRGDELSFITALEEISTKNHLTQKMNIFISDETKTGTQQLTTAEITALPFQLTLDGNFYSFLTYLTDLEASNYYLNIEKIQISQSQKITNIFFEEELTPLETDVHIILNGISYWQ